MTTIRRKGVFVGMVTTVGGVAIALPFAVIHPALPFTVLFGSLGGVWMLYRWRWLPKYPTAYLAGCLVALLSLLPAVSLIQFAEQGWADGPFQGVVYEQGTTGLPVGDRLNYRQGELVVFNRQPSNPPVLAYQVNDAVQWARSLDLSQQPGYEAVKITDLKDLSLAYGILRDRLTFTVTWNFGTEQGHAYIWKWDGLQRFYLSR